MICHAPGPDLAGPGTPENGLPEDRPLPARGEVTQGRACLVRLCLRLGVL